MRTVTLDRRQRGALRAEIQLSVHECSEMTEAVKRGDRAYCARSLDRLRDCFAALDAIGWSESDEAPDVQTLDVEARLQAWATAKLGSSATTSTNASRATRTSTPTARCARSVVSADAFDRRPIPAVHSPGDAPARGSRQAARRRAESRSKLRAGMA